jgi:hypothetical protein
LADYISGSRSPKALFVDDGAAMIVASTLVPVAMRMPFASRCTRQKLFLDEIERIIPWSALESVVRPQYVKAGNGRQPVGLSIMLRTNFVQQWFNLSDCGAEELLYESAAVRNSVGVDLGIAPAPGETTVLRFRHMFERSELGGLMLEVVNRMSPRVHQINQPGC